MSNALNPILGFNTSFQYFDAQVRAEMNDQLSNTFLGMSRQDSLKEREFEPIFFNSPTDSQDYFVFCVNVSQQFTDESSMAEPPSRAKRSTNEEILHRLLQIQTKNDLKRRMDDETRWLAVHRTEYAGQWIALQGNHLIGHADNAAAIFELVRGMQPKPMVMQIESNVLPFGGW